jgi:hypothetical protein
MLRQAGGYPTSVVRRTPNERRRGSIGHLIREGDWKLLVGLLFLIAVDFGFVVIHVFHRVYIALYNDGVSLLDWRWRIGSDHSYAEMFGYAKGATLVALLIATYSLSRKWLYVIWAGVFLYVLFDDALLIHERLGRAVAGPSGSRWDWDMGQLAVWILAGMILLGIAVAGLAHSSGQDRTNGILLLLALAALGFFAAVVDLVHVIFRSSFRGANLLFTILEDGGEQLALTIVLGLAVLIQRSKRQPSLADRGRTGAISKPRFRP